VQATEWSEAFDLVAESGAVAKMGGCDVMTRSRRGTLDASLVVGLHRLPGVSALDFDGASAKLGAGVTLSRVASAPELELEWPALWEVVRSVASPAIRSTGTVVGNVAAGWPVSDIVPLLEVYGARLQVADGSSERAISVAEYASTPGRGALQPRELITGVELPVPAPELRVGYARFSLRNAGDLPLVSVAVAARSDNDNFGDVRVVAVGGSAMPSRCSDVEAVLEGGPADDRSIEAAEMAIAAWARPTDDHHASAGYRRRLLAVTLRRALRKILLPDARR
jgi:CO/xanthine dehydrogenase FAD-binding subunit